MNFVVVKDIAQGIERTKEFLYDKVDRKTVLFLSGGKTPRPLYETLANEKIITPAAVGLIDERYGSPMHENSNELMIQKSGLSGYLEKQNIPFYPMLKAKRSQEEAVRDYDQTVRDLFFKFPRSVGVIGIGDDGHIASIFPTRKDFINPLLADVKTYEYVRGVDDPGKYGQRITLTFAGLSLLDFYLVFVFGKEKKKALKATLAEGSVEQIPARFFQRPEISDKTLFITDQKI